jgi:hypothetical protein
MEMLKWRISRGRRQHRDARGSECEYASIIEHWQGSLLFVTDSRYQPTPSAETWLEIYIPFRFTTWC